MKKIFCGAVIALIGVIYSIALMVMATINNVYSGDVAPRTVGIDTRLWCGTSAYPIFSCRCRRNCCLYLGYG